VEHGPNAASRRTLVPMLAAGGRRWPRLKEAVELLERSAAEGCACAGGAGESSGSLP